MNNAHYIVNCPNCGGNASRHFLAKDKLIRTQCPHCDYLMITCSHTGNVIEAYAPGLMATTSR
ncbi:MAG: replication restart DNA helicase PriA [Cyanobacteria bacterium P01_F01_bin.56]